MQLQPHPSNADTTSNQAAYAMLLGLIDRTGLSRRGFLARLADVDERFSYSEAALTNWGRPGRAFPRHPGLLRAIVRVLVEQPTRYRCRADEAVRLGVQAALPLGEIEALGDLFPHETLRDALADHLALALL